MEAEKCKTCKRAYSVDCDWNQGRCPHHPALYDYRLMAAMPEYYFRFIEWSWTKTVWQTIKGWFNRGK